MFWPHLKIWEWEWICGSAVCGLTSPKFPVASLLRSAASNSGGGSASTLFAKLMKASCKSAVLSFRKSFCRPDHQLSSCKQSKILLDAWTSIAGSVETGLLPLFEIYLPF